MYMNIEKNLIVFGSDPDFADNPRGFWEYIKTNKNYRTFWIIKNREMYEHLKNNGVECALENSELAKEMIARANYLISASFDFAYEKRPEQIHISAWHGFPLKVVGFFDSATASTNNYDGLKIITTQTDLVTATSRFSHLTVSGMFAMDPRKVKEIGYPRNDLMLKSNAKEELKKIVDIDVDNSKLFFYLPTMRRGLKDEGEHFENNIFNYSDYDVDSIDEFLEKNNAYIIAKLHFADNDLYNGGEFKLPKRFILLDTDIMNRKMSTIYHIIKAFDGLITDYSSIYVDYLLLDKPIIFSCPDIEKFRQDRGFIVDDPSVLMPGAIVKNQEQLLYNLSEIIKQNDAYKDERKHLMSLFHNHLDGNSSERLLEEMINLDNGERIDSGKEVGRLFQKNVSPLNQYVDKSVKAEIYFDRGNGLSENDKIIREIQFDNLHENGNNNIEIEIDNSVKMVRFDPDDIGRAVISSLEIYVDGVKQNDYSVIGGYEYNNMIYFKTVDPQIIIPVNVEKKCMLKLVFNCYDIYISAVSIIEENIEEINKSFDIIENKQSQIESLKAELEEVYSSSSWKLTKWYRKCGDFVKQIKRK